MTALQMPTGDRHLPHSIGRVMPGRTKIRHSNSRQFHEPGRAQPKSFAPVLWDPYEPSKTHFIAKEFELYLAHR